MNRTHNRITYEKEKVEMRETKKQKQYLNSAINLRMGDINNRNEPYHTETLTARKRKERKNRVAVFLLCQGLYSDCT